MKKSPAIPRWWDWPAVALLFILLQILASRLVNTSWTPFLYLTQAFASIGLVLGLALGYSHFRRGTARWLSFFYMLVLLPLLWTLVIDQRVSLEEQLSSVVGRLLFSTSELIARRPVDDPFFFVAVMSITFWIISASAGFSLTRHQNYLRAVIPSAIGILVIQHYDNAVPGRILALGFFTFFALLLLGRMNFLQNQVSWQKRRVFISAENSLDLAGGMAILAGVIIFASFFAPASRSGINSAMKVWNRITKPWQDFTERMENAVSALDSPSGGRPGEFYGTELMLGRGFPLSEAVMFEVEAPELSFEERPPRYYWRGRTYDYFATGQWYTTGTTREEYSPDTDGFSISNVTVTAPQRFSFSVGEAKFSLLYAPSQPVWFSRPGSFLAVPADTGKEVISWNATPTLLPGETYQVEAVLFNPNIQQLREAGTDYPEWVLNKYLQMPAGFSPRIKELARELTVNVDAPYDKAVIITNYLRETIKYSETIPLAPRNQDLLEWVLFEHREGYCVYYATAEVLMLRSLGIPARMAVGFAQGQPTTLGDDIAGEERIIPNSFTVRKKNAHAWPEAYFPDIGWVEFEPTGNQVPLSRPAAPSPDSGNIFPPNSNPLIPEDDRLFREEDLPENPKDPATAADTPIDPRLYLIPLFIALAALAVFLGRRFSIPSRVPVFLRASIERSGGKVPIWIIHWESWTYLSPIEKAFDSINFGLRLLKQPVPIHSTPLERADALSRTLPHMAGQIKVLLDEHQTSLYTSRTADVTRAQRSALDIRWQIIVARIRHFLTGTYTVQS